MQLDLLLPGIPIWSSEGPLGQSSVAAVDERILLDTGSITRRDMLLDAMDAVGIDPEDVGDVLLTHLHWDHCENLSLFPNATVHLHEEQLDRLRRGESEPRTPSSGEAIIEHHDVEAFTAGPVTGGVEAVWTPGHTEHHVSFTFTDEPTHLFAGDAIKSANGFTSGQPSSFYDRDVARDTHRRIKADYDFVVPGHDSPFYVDGDAAVPAVNVDVTFDVKFGADAATSMHLTSDRGGLRPLPDVVSVSAIDTYSE